MTFLAAFGFDIPEAGLKYLFGVGELTHIGKLSGNDSGDFPETFSIIYDFK